MAYDAGILNDYGGGNVEWWHDYIRSLLSLADEHYQDEINRGEEESTTLEAENKRLRTALENLINDHPGQLQKDKPTTLQEAELVLKGD